MKITKRLIQIAKEVPLFDIIRFYVKLKSNQNGYIGLCPFHKEKTPSFSIKPGVCYKCFGCDVKGSNPVDFIMKHDGKNFEESVIEVLNLTGIYTMESEKSYQKTRMPISKSTTGMNKFNVLSLIPTDLVNKSIPLKQGVSKIAESNRFVEYLINLFGSKIAYQLINKYCIGTSKYRFKNKEFPDYESKTGATIFWLKDARNQVRSGKIMLYDETSGKRIKIPFDHITWVHSVLKLQDYGFKRCFFGEHLLADSSKPIAIVESEKTAIIASVYLPQFIWLAVGGKGNLCYEICKILKGRSVSLFPDLNAYEDWSCKAKEFSDIGFFQVSDLLHRNANAEDMVHGFDLADYLVKFNYKEFQ